VGVDAAVGGINADVEFGNAVVLQRVQGLRGQFGVYSIGDRHGCGSDERLTHDHACTVERQGRRAIQLVAEIKHFADSSTESSVVGAGEDPVSREIFGVGHGVLLRASGRVAGLGAMV
jgi:hypothetical protein